MGARTCSYEKWKCEAIVIKDMGIFRPFVHVLSSIRKPKYVMVSKSEPMQPQKVLLDISQIINAKIESEAQLNSLLGNCKKKIITEGLRSSLASMQ